MRRILTDFDGVWNPLGYAPDLAFLMPYQDLAHGTFRDLAGDRHNVFVSTELMAFLRAIAEDPAVELLLLSSWNVDIDDSGFTSFGFPIIRRLPWGRAEGSAGCFDKVSAALSVADDRPTLWMEDELISSDLERLAEGNSRRSHPIQLLATTGWKGLSRENVAAIESFLAD